MSERVTSSIDLQPAMWIWDPRVASRHGWLEAEHTVELKPGQELGAELLITASTLYHLCINGRPVGHGPAKSAKGRVSVDRIPVGHLLQTGSNRIVVTVHHVGVGTMTWCRAEPGLLFRLQAGDGEVLAASGLATRVRPDPHHARPTVRRWLMPVIEDLDLMSVDGAWEAAQPVDPGLSLYERRVPLPSRRLRVPVRVAAALTVEPPSQVLSLRLKPYLVDTPAEEDRTNTFATAALLVAEIDSPVAQELSFLPAMGSVAWFIDGRLVANSNGWGHDGMVGLPPVQIPAGRTRLLGLHRNNHFEDITVVLRGESAAVGVRNPYGAGWVQVLRLPGAQSPETPVGLDPDALARMAMDPADGGPDRNAFARLMNARTVAGADLAGLRAQPASGPLSLPAPAANRATRLVFDFGWVMNGQLSVTLASERPGRLTAAWTEYAEASADGSGLLLQWPNCNNAMTMRFPAGTHAVEGFCAHGGRYLVLDWEGEADLHLTAPGMLDANCTSREIGQLDTDQPLHAGIWDLCRQSVISGVDDTFTDCPTFEQVGWNFDNRTAWMGERWLCANQAVAANSMLLFAEDPEFHGLVRSQYPSGWDNHIPLWSFHWILWVRDFWWHSGDAATARSLMPRLAAGLADALGRLDAGGLMAWEGVWHFIEWGNGRDDGHAVCTVDQAGLWAALQAGEEMAAALGIMTAEASAWRAARLRLGEAIERRLWCVQRGAWADSLHADGTPSPVSSQVTNAWLACLGIGGEARAANIAGRILAGDRGLLAYGSPLGLYYILELYCRTGHHAEALAIIERRWGEMLAAGDRTTWETFPEYGLKHGAWATRSRCHPFAAYAAGMLVRILAGVEVLAPGCRRIRLNPTAPSAVGCCRAVLPTPHGPLGLAWERRSDGSLRWTVDAPPGVEIEGG